MPTEITDLEPIDERVSVDGQTRKVLFLLADGKTVEAALMLSRVRATGRERHTVCVSSQVGCAVGCGFCATGRQGFERNLTTAEILRQIRYFAGRFGGGENEKKGRLGWLSNVVFMGMGEPLANYENVLAAVAYLNSPKGYGLGANQITLSTAGLAPQIRRLAEDNAKCVLAVSLHAAGNELRDRLVPVNKKYPLAELISACKEYNQTTGRNIYIEYALFEGINDSASDADALLAVLKDLECSINLIQANPACPGEYNPSSRETAMAFQKRLIEGGKRAMLRVSRGADIEAGCGQLRSRWLGKPP
jgi:23S rRNA (adenine2503-C2)-methyltransferase